MSSYAEAYKNLDAEQNNQNDPVHLTFAHALSRLCFKVVGWESDKDGNGLLFLGLSPMKLRTHK